jgi:hypothetical protein
MEWTYRIRLAHLPDNICGLEVRLFDRLLKIMRWVEREIIVTSSRKISPTSPGLVICFYTPSNEAGAKVLKKHEAMIEEIEDISERRDAEDVEAGEKGGKVYKAEK